MFNRHQEFHQCNICQWYWWLITLLNSPVFVFCISN
uniref:Uncharacterized protein n=1 Tax=Rhizophora mucronata TaxID=61149 RepID=A0A2P2N771_RHIMU